MPVDIRNETVIPAHKAPKHIGPIGRNGSLVHRDTIVKAIIAGELEGFRCGSTWATSIEAIERWLEAQTRDHLAQGNRPEGRRATRRRSTAEQERVLADDHKARKALGLPEREPATSQ